MNGSISGRQINRNSTLIADLKAPHLPQLDFKVRNRMSMFEPQSRYIADPPNTPIPYLELFNLENPKFDQELFKAPKQLDAQRKPAQRQFRNIETCFAKPIYSEETLTRAGRTRQREIELERPHISPRLNLPVIDKTAAEPVKPSVMNKSLINIKPILKNSVDIIYESVKALEVKTLSPPPVKMRTKRLNISSANEAPLSLPAPNKFPINRFSMYEPSCQKSYNRRTTLKEIRPINFEENSNRLAANSFANSCVEYEVPRSIKDRIKMFSK